MTQVLNNGLVSQVSAKKLIAVYAIVPILLTIFVADFYMNGMLKFLLPKQPEQWSIWIYIFGMPHVFASFFLLADKEYTDYFGTKLWAMASLILVLPYFIMNQFGYPVMFALFTAMIVYHTVAQQFGIALILAKRRPDWIHKANTIIGSLAGVLIYIYIYAEGTSYIKLRPYTNVFLFAGWGMISVVAALTFVQIKSTKERYGQIYMGLNLMLLVFMMSMYHYGFSLLVVIAGRVVHEFTAWQIYASHDKNRNHETTHNIVYRAFAWTGVSTYWLGMLLAFVFGISFTLLSTMNQNFLSLLIVSLSLYHYWVECVIWKGQSPPKKHIAFV